MSEVVLYITVNSCFVFVFLSQQYALRLCVGEALEANFVQARWVHFMEEVEIIPDLVADIFGTQMLWFSLLRQQKVAITIILLYTFYRSREGDFNCPWQLIFLWNNNFSFLVSAPSPPEKKSGGLGISAWGIITLIVCISMVLIAVYYFMLFYPILCRKESKYNVMETESSAWRFVPAGTSSPWPNNSASVATAPAVTEAPGVLCEKYDLKIYETTMWKLWTRDLLNLCSMCSHLLTNRKTWPYMRKQQNNCVLRSKANCIVCQIQT